MCPLLGKTHHRLRGQALTLCDSYTVRDESLVYTREVYRPHNTSYQYNVKQLTVFSTVQLTLYQSVSEIKDLFRAPGHKIWDLYVCLEQHFLYDPYKFRVHSLQNPCTRLENHAPRVQGALLISDTASIEYNKL